MPARLVVTGALLLLLTAACSNEGDPKNATPTPSIPTSATPTTSQPKPTTIEPSPTCELPLGGVPESQSGFVVELNIMSGNPNPAWGLTNAQGSNLRRLLHSDRQSIDVDGPDNLGGLAVTADGRAARFLTELGLPTRFWVEGDNEISSFLHGTLPCHP